MLKDVTVITGASMEIGKAIALTLAKENHNLALFGRDEAKLSEVKNEVEKLGAVKLSRFQVILPMLIS